MKRIAALVSSRNRPDLVERMVAQLRRPSAHRIDVYVVECGTELGQVSPHATLWYPDAEFRGKCYGHNLALEQARTQGAIHGAYDYYWVLMNDVFLEDQTDPVAVLVEQMEREPRLAILSPTNADGGYPAAERVPGGDWRPVTTCDYLGFLMRADAVDEVGFLGADFAYCWGAIHELAFKLYSAGWTVGYSDRVWYQHLGGSTYGVKGTNTISREEYQRRAKRYAYDVLRARYGEDWDQRFLAATRPHGIEHDTFAAHREFWLTGFDDHERAEREAARNVALARAGRPFAERLLPTDELDGLRVSLGAGRDRTPGWIHVDTNPDVAPDVVADVHRLPMFEDGSVAVIEANHLFEHLTLDEARAALAEWRRILAPGGALYLELPDLERCAAMIGRYTDPQGYDMGTIGIFGYPPLVRDEGVPQIHKWGWTRAALAAELEAAGFEQVEFGPTLQDWRPAARVGRDMRVRAATARASARERGLPTAAATPVSSNASPSNPPIGRTAAAAVPALATAEAPARDRLLLAWPRWDEPSELEALFAEFSGAVAAHPDLRLAIHLHADECDHGAACEALEAAFGAAADGRLEVDVELVQGPLSPELAERLARLTVAVVDLPSLRARGPRALDPIDAPRVTRRAELERLLARSTEPRPSVDAPAAALPASRLALSPRA